MYKIFDFVPFAVKGKFNLFNVCLRENNKRYGVINTSEGNFYPLCYECFSQEALKEIFTFIETQTKEKESL